MRNADVSRKTLVNSLGASHTVSIIVLLFATHARTITRYISSTYSHLPLPTLTLLTLTCDNLSSHRDPLTSEEGLAKRSP